MDTKILLYVCDDEREGQQATVQSIHAAFPEDAMELAVFSGAAEVRQALEKAAPDIAVLDIHLQQENGIALAREILRANPHSRILFVSGYLMYAPDVYDVEHVCFVLKSQIEQRLPVFLGRAYAQICAERASVLQIRLSDDKRLIQQSDILYLESLRRVIRVVTKTEQLQTYGKLSEFERNLNPTRFQRCHQSFIVGLDYVSSLSRSEINLQDGKKIPISRPYQKLVQNGYLRYLQAKESIL